MGLILNCSDRNRCYSGSDAVGLAVEDEAVGLVAANGNGGGCRVVEEIGGRVAESEVVQAVAAVVTDVPADGAGGGVDVVEAEDVFDEEGYGAEGGPAAEVGTDALAVDIVRIHLREEDENDGTNGNRAAEYIEQEEHKHEDAAELLREYEVEAYHQQGENHAGNLLALASHFVEGIYRALGLAADFGTDVPASEAVVLLAIHLPHLVNDMYRIS